MSADGKRLVLACLTCQINKSSEVSTTKTLKTGAVMDQISIDLAGPFTVTSSGNTMILVAIDHYSK